MAQSSNWPNAPRFSFGNHTVPAWAPATILTGSTCMRCGRGMSVTGDTVVGDGGILLLSLANPLGFFSTSRGIGAISGPPIAISTALGAEHLGVSCLGSGCSRSIRSISSWRSLITILRSRGEIVGSLEGGRDEEGSERDRPFLERVTGDDTKPMSRSGTATVRTRHRAPSASSPCCRCCACCCCCCCGEGVGTKLTQVAARGRRLSGEGPPSWAAEWCFGMAASLGLRLVVGPELRISTAGGCGVPSSSESEDDSDKSLSENCTRKQQQQQQETHHTPM